MNEEETRQTVQQSIIYRDTILDKFSNLIDEMENQELLAFLIACISVVKTCPYYELEKVKKLIDTLYIEYDNFFEISEKKE
jgi:hypothetical protein